MWDKVKSFLFKFFVLVLNAGLVIGGVFIIKDQQQKKQVAQDLANNTGANQDAQGIAAQVAQLQQIVEQNKQVKDNIVANNPATITVQKPTTVTQTIPAVTKTVQVPVKTTAPAPKATTKKS